jgi:conjugative transfer signal peptidase TraF
MTRLGYSLATMVAGQLAMLAAVFHPTPRLYWNASASAPVGLYWLKPGGHPARGELVAIDPPQSLRQWLADRHYLPRGVPLLKTVVAAEGLQVCRTGRDVSVDGTVVAVARERDSHGRALPRWSGCHSVARNSVMLLNAAPDSLDGRYFGPIPLRGLRGRMVPLLTRDVPTGPLLWRGFAP